MTATRNASLAGIGMMLLGILLFSVNDVMGKWLVATYSVGQVLLIRSIAGLIVLAPFVIAQGWRRTLRPARPGAQALRVLFGCGDVALFYAAVSHLPLADTMTIWLAAPVFVVVLAAVILRETVDAARWGAVVVGFAGVAVALGPSAASLSAPAGMALLGSLCFSAMMIAGRQLRGTPDVTLVAWQTAGAALIGLALLPFGWVTPSLRDTALLSLLGIVAMVAHLCVTRSLKLAEASVVVPYQYTLLIWALVFGWFVFGDWPTPAMLAGAGLIIVAGLALLVLERRASSLSAKIEVTPASVP
ncbi:MULTISPECIES: DMT family transporter [unclassified Bosea (in: a-proteobacteria)]|uniref:DMT family transporter n=1 Tax=unclassified Bosea (in: a-proteobacteria) TaxID=2653178 RepID=UPI0009545AE4|nr:MULTISPECIES: DMT family transporter [unclassified Bosea (in: a-proteobacteria)]TAJ31330.1 MAG: DMT family transporter [Bosea sp. (in: a-proteobacteria)]SIQ32550.1 EamA domain-containing membrane protein RarD [Bosea sp. TND4EK4]